MKSWQIGDGEMYQFCALFGKVCDTTNLLVLFPFTYFYSLLLFSNKRQRVTYCLVLPLLTFICTLCKFKCFSRGYFNNKVLKYFSNIEWCRIIFTIREYLSTNSRYFSFLKSKQNITTTKLVWRFYHECWKIKMIGNEKRINNLWCYS